LLREIFYCHSEPAVLRGEESNLDSSQVRFTRNDKSAS